MVIRIVSSPTSVWATAGHGSGSTGARLLHLTGTHWSAFPIPWPVHLSVASSASNGAGISPDGHGGFWIPTVSFNGPYWMLHFSSGKWSRVSIGANAINGAVLIPGTRSLWGVGEILKKASADGAIWAYGRVS